MSPKPARLTAKDVIKRLTRCGFQEVFQTGLHIKFFNSLTRRIVVVPVHQNKVLSIETLKAIEK